jgi:hypothetical protein
VVLTVSKGHIAVFYTLHEAKEKLKVKAICSSRSTKPSSKWLGVISH